MRAGRLLLIGLAAAAIAAPAAPAAPGKLIGDGADSGLPQAFAKGRVLQPRAILIRITADPNEAVEVRWDTNCARRAKGRVRDGEYDVTGRDLVRVKKGFKRPTDCLVNVLAAYVDAGQEGRIEIEIFARGRNARPG